MAAASCRPRTEPITADETARESEDLWEPTEEDEQDIVQGCIFPTAPNVYCDKVKDYDESAPCLPLRSSTWRRTS